MIKKYKKTCRFDLSNAYRSFQNFFSFNKAKYTEKSKKKNIAHI